MKREAIGHTKMKKLCRYLDLPTWGAVGLMESLFHLTAREAPRGDIGRLSNEDIAIGIDWRGDTEALIKALVDSDWLDESDEHRLILHDWSEHADNTVHFHLSFRKMVFLDGTKPHRNRHLKIFSSTQKSRRRDRMREAGSIGKRLRNDIFARDGSRCRFCGSDSDLTLDHIVPITANGKSVPSNLQVLCRPCNSSKRDRIEVLV